MALTFSLNDLADISSLATTAPDPVVYWTWVKSKTASADLIEICDFQIAEWTANGTTPQGAANRLADAVQELQAIEQTLTLERSEDVGQGKITNAFLSLATVRI